MGHGHVIFAPASMQPTHGSPRPARQRGAAWLVAVRIVGLVGGAVVLLVLLPDVALAQTETLSGILGRIQTVISALLAAGATVVLMVAGGRYLWGSATGDLEQHEQAKRGIRAAAIGYAVAALAGMLVGLLQYVVGA